MRGGERQEGVVIERKTQTETKTEASIRDEKKEDRLMDGWMGRRIKRIEGVE